MFYEAHRYAAVIATLVSVATTTVNKHANRVMTAAPRSPDAFMILSHTSSLHRMHKPAAKTIAQL